MLKRLQVEEKRMVGGTTQAGVEFRCIPFSAFWAKSCTICSYQFDN
jgi:hypothetical protein